MNERLKIINTNEMLLFSPNFDKHYYTKILVYILRTSAVYSADSPLTKLKMI